MNCPAGRAGVARSDVFARGAGKSDAVLRTVMLALSRKVMLPASAGSEKLFVF